MRQHRNPNEAISCFGQFFVVVRPCCAATHVLPQSHRDSEKFFCFLGASASLWQKHGTSILQFSKSPVSNL